MPRENLSESDEQLIRTTCALASPLIIRFCRTLVQAVKVPNREENRDGEKRFADALADLVVHGVESVRMVK